MNKIWLLLGFALLPVWSQATTIKALTYNIFRKPEPLGLGGTHAKSRLKRLCHELKQTSYDVILLQEVWVAKDRRTLKDCGYPYALDMGEAIGEYTIDDPEFTLESGLLILSRHPFVAKKRITYSKRGSWWRLLQDGERLARKSAYAGQIALPDGQSLWVVNTHLTANYCNSYPYERCNSYENVRAVQLAELAEFTADLHGPVLMGGILIWGRNLVARDAVWDRFDDFFPGFRQAPYDVILHSTSSRRNNFNHYELGKIDHLFASPELTPITGDVVYTQLMNIEGRSLHLSDHFGWETSFVLE